MMWGMSAGSVGEEDLPMALFIYHIESYDHYSIV